MDGLERGAITPKTAEQMNQCMKTPIGLARLEIQFRKMLMAAGRVAPVPRSPILRSAIGLNPDQILPSDGAQVRAMIGEH